MEQDAHPLFKDSKLWDLFFCIYSAMVSLLLRPIIHYFHVPQIMYDLASFGLFDL